MSELHQTADDERCPDCDGVLLGAIGPCKYGWGNFVKCIECGEVFDFEPCKSQATVNGQED